MITTRSLRASNWHHPRNRGCLYNRPDMACTKHHARTILRTEINYSGTVIALVSGAAASLSLATGLSSVLVGVMVSVALMPPAVNIVSIKLSAKPVFLLKGIQPRIWIEARKASQSRILYFLVWITLLALLIAMIYLRHKTSTT